MTKEEYKKRQTVNRVLASKCNREIRNYCDKIEKGIDESWNEDKFLNLSVWTDAITNQIKILVLADKLSTKDYRNFKKLE